MLRTRNTLEAELPGADVPRKRRYSAPIACPGCSSNAALVRSALSGGSDHIRGLYSCAACRRSIRVRWFIGFQPRITIEDVTAALDAALAEYGDADAPMAVLLAGDVVSDD